LDIAPCSLRVAHVWRSLDLDVAVGTAPWSRTETMMTLGASVLVDGPLRLSVGVPTRAHYPRLEVSEDGAEIPFDVHFLRSAKRALKQALRQESGALDEDALACVDALAVANPTMPNPSADDDLWADGSFALLSDAFSGATSGRIVQRGAALVDVDGLGGFELSATLGLMTPTSEAAASLHIVGTASAVGDAELELRCDQLTVAVDDAAGASADELASLLSACAEAAGLQLEHAGTPSSLKWAADKASFPPVRLGQLYLDQDCHILVRLEDGARLDQPIVLFAEGA
jgi:hypothetical protein